ncbi:MAG: TlpA disulfide reductase family protein [Pseudomonadota bacterium]|nr:TlpA disulfide reductase family protein [Pseudomonadota bacterium]
MKKLIFYFLIAVLPLTASAAAPKLNLKDLSGNSHQLSEYIGNGQWTVVVMWANDCHVCNTEMPAIDMFHEEFKDKNASILGVSVDGWDKIDTARDFVKRHDLSFPNLILEPDMKYIGKFGGGDFVGTPTFYIYTPEGEIVAAQAGGVPMNIIEDFIRDYKKK